jgi:hypothetical protein
MCPVLPADAFRVLLGFGPWVVHPGSSSGRLRARYFSAGSIAKMNDEKEVGPLALIAHSVQGSL